MTKAPTNIHILTVKLSFRADDRGKSQTYPEEIRKANQNAKYWYRNVT